MKHAEQTVCPYCSGNGYVQLLLGGSETVSYTHLTLPTTPYV